MVQSVLMQGVYRQELQADAGGPGPADCGIIDQDRAGLTGNMQLHGELHAGKGADDTVYAASLGRKVSDGPCMAEVIPMHQGAGERHGKSGMLSGDHSCALSDSYAAMFTWVARNCSRRARSSSCISRNSTPNSSSRVHRTVAARMVMARGCSGIRRRTARRTPLLYRKIAHDLAATQPEVVYDPYPGMVARECSREFHLIANVLPLFRHI